jgi:hypothetical protein
LLVDTAIAVYEPLVQSWHASVDCPENFPAGQSKQCVAPGVGWNGMFVPFDFATYLPGEQNVQDEVACEENQPALQALQ